MSSTTINFADPRYSEEDLRSLSKQLVVEIERRVQQRTTPAILRRFGRNARRMKIRECKGCHKLYGAREMRSHSCSISYLKR